MSLELTPLAEESLAPQVLRAVKGPPPARMMAAKGLLPLGPRELVVLLYQLSFDSDAKVADGALETAEKLPEKVLVGALGEALDPRVLDFFAHRVIDNVALVEMLLLNQALADETLVYYGETLQERELEILAGNQRRILKHPEIISAIYFNTNARMSTVKRLLELAVRNEIELDLPQFKEIRASILGEQSGAEEVADEEAAQMQALEQDLMDEAFNEAMSLGEEFADRPEEEAWGEREEAVSAPERRVTRLLDRSLVEKIRMASAGQLFHRQELIRDSNRAVSMAVITSPAVTDHEAQRYAANRSLNDEVIRYIAGRKDWVKNYQIKLALTNNPKCPLPNAMRLLPHLRPNDLRALSRSKNISAALAQAAKQLMSKRR